MLPMPSGGSYITEVPGGGATVRRMWERPHHRTTYPRGNTEYKTDGTEQTASNSVSERHDGEYREPDEQGMTISITVSITVGKRQRVETDSSNFGGKHKNREEGVRLRYSR